MKQPTDKSIVKWIEDKEYSQLSFLDTIWNIVDNPKYLGFYYFIQLQKGGDIDVVWRQVLEEKKSESDAYLYLGEIGQEIYNSFNKYYISADFYRKSIEYNENNAEALWRLYRLSRRSNDLFLLRSLKVDFELGNTDNINHKLLNVYVRQDFGLNFSREDWCELKKILLNSETRKKDELLILTYYHLGEMVLGLDIIGQLKQRSVSYEVLKPYIDIGIITKKEVTDKVYSFQVREVLADNNEAIFVQEKEIFKEELRKDDGSRVIKSNVTASAFRAKAYSEVIEIFDDKDTDDSFSYFDKKHNLHYIISQLIEGRELNKDIYDKILSWSDEFRDEEKTLYKILKVYLSINKITKDINNQNILSYSQFNPNFQRANQILKDKDVIVHWMYDSLRKHISELSIEWNKKNEESERQDLYLKIKTGEYNRNDFRQYISALIDSEKYSQAINELVLIKIKFPLYITELNQLGVCYERINDYVSAYKYYKLALDCMVKSKDYNNVIISNYIHAIEKLDDVKLTSEEFSFLKELYNMSLCNSFNLQIFTFKNRGSAFKYQPFNINTIDSLTNQYFYLAKKEQLNDPIEMPLLEGVGGDALMCSDYRIYSLTNNNDSMLMWSHYADQHQGIMVEYWFGCELPDGVGIQKISYDHSKLRKDNQYRFNQYILTKNKDWEYEDEVRLFSHKKEKVFYENYSYPNVNLDKINASVKSITLGLKFPKDKIQLVKNIIQSINRNRSEHIPSIMLKQAELDPNNQFELIYNSIVMG